MSPVIRLGPSVRVNPDQVIKRPRLNGRGTFESLRVVLNLILRSLIFFGFRPSNLGQSQMPRRPCHRTLNSRVSSPQETSLNPLTSKCVVH